MFASLGDDTGGSFELLNLTQMDEWDQSEILRREKEALGFYITGHPLDRFMTEVKHFATCVIQDLSGQEDRSSVNVAGMVERLRAKRTKRGDKMAILTLEDPTGSIEVVIFPDVFETHSALLKNDAPILVSGTLEVDEGGGKIICQKITSMDTVKQNAIKALEFPIDGHLVSKEKLEDIKDIMIGYPGDCSVIFRVKTDRGKDVIVEADRHYHVFPCNELIGEIESILGSKAHYRYGKENSNHRLPDHP
jgi:DNA polymerase-3 subunit alpha